MKAILDTHVFLWIGSGDARLSRKARRIIEDADNELFLSAASLWEMILKHQAGKLKLEGGPEDFLLSSLARYAVLPIDVEFRHVLRMLKLPALHRDPFDRLLIAQAQELNLPILTSDRFIRQYKVDLW